MCVGGGRSDAGPGGCLKRWQHFSLCCRRLVVCCCCLDRHAAVDPSMRRHTTPHRQVTHLLPCHPVRFGVGLGLEQCRLLLLLQAFELSLFGELLQPLFLLLVPLCCCLALGALASCSPVGVLLFLFLLGLGFGLCAGMWERPQKRCDCCLLSAAARGVRLLLARLSGCRTPLLLPSSP